MEKDTEIVIKNINKRLDKIEDKQTKIEDKQDKQSEKINALAMEVVEIKTENKQQTIILKELKDSWAEFDKKRAEEREAIEQRRLEEQLDTKRTIKHKVIDVLVGAGITSFGGFALWLINNGFLK